MCVRVCAVVNYRILLFSKTKSYSIACMCHIFFLCLSVAGHLGWVYFLAVLLLLTSWLHLLRPYFQLVPIMHQLCFMFSRSLTSFPTMAALIFLSSGKDFLFSTSSTTVIFYYYFFPMGASTTGGILISIFLMMV